MLDKLLAAGAEFVAGSLFYQGRVVGRATVSGVELIEPGLDSAENLKDDAEAAPPVAAKKVAAKKVAAKKAEPETPAPETDLSDLDSILGE